MRTWIPIAVVLLVLAAAAPPAWAGDDGGGGLDMAGQVNWWSIGTSIVVFLILLIVLSKTAWSPILAGLQKREDTIKKSLDDAAAAHEEAKALITRYEEKLDKARQEAQEIFEETRRDAQAIRAQAESDAKQRAEETVARARREVEQLTAQAWHRLVRDAASVATEAASRIISKELTVDGHAAIVADVVSQFAGSRGPASDSPISDTEEPA